ncbi:pyridoxal 5'-phosphate synthase [Streptomyces sp. TRM66268-LWL]|uniref:Pyridoxal 5'-phosphate synthase n=1 Tax=Streptomyces polyasparticus TaxID=2767826 RepID=A0ABR7SPD2_9ACTN|nr:pyridoxal 5'-phosphate synthase [Streptomyces polyasparticus]MBC9716381.1 pyridoxal 5'-phosphate synthase [Streptomyces polyasparticus]
MTSHEGHAPHQHEGSAPHEAAAPTPAEFTELLRAQRVWDVELPEFDPAAAPGAPLLLFRRWFAEAVAAGQTEPHTMQLATADAAGCPDVRTLMLHGADEAGWHFASHATSSKGRQLAARPEAALHFYWPAQARQIRLRGPVTAAPSAESQADLHARSTGALAAALVGRQSELLVSQKELARESAAAWERAQAEPTAPVPTWTLYVLDPVEVEYFQGDARRRHIRLRYRRDGNGGWTRELLWP